MCKNVSESGDVRRPNGNGRPSAFSYKSFNFFSVILSHSDQSQTPLQSRTVGGFHQGRAASFQERTRANKRSEKPGQIRMTSAGTFQNLALQTMFMHCNLQTRPQIQRKHSKILKSTKNTKGDVRLSVQAAVLMVI